MKSWNDVIKLSNEVMQPIGENMLTDAEISYNKLDFRLKAQICLEYLGSQERFTEFEAWRDELSIKADWLTELVDYCENEDKDFWMWVSR